MRKLAYRHVDVFTDRPFSGNGLTVFVQDAELSAPLMQEVTREMRQFESIFLFPTGENNAFRARVFTIEEELDFAGHPTLGAACVLHERLVPAEESATWKLVFNHKESPVRTSRLENRYLASMEQGVPEIGAPVAKEKIDDFLRALNLSRANCDENFPPEVISLGLPYLIVPVKNGLADARIAVPDFEARLAEIGAKFVYVFDFTKLEGRTWDNEGKTEDAATGSAAGPTGVYLFRRGSLKSGEEIILNQGAFVGRPSRLKVKVTGAKDAIESVEVSGEVVMMSSGVFDEGVFSTLRTDSTVKSEELSRLKFEANVA
jgi:trans-2,3-dihydro-3-hydroxyanthranilate isomerase